MINRIIIIILLLLILISELQSQDYNSYIINYKGNESELIQKLSQINPKIEKSFKFINTKKLSDNYSFLSNKQLDILVNLNNYYSLKIGSSLEINDIYNNLKNDTNFISLSPNYIYQIEQGKNFPNDSLFQNQWYLKVINAEHISQNFSGKGVIIGLIDTGVDFTHPDLIDNLWINSDEDLNQNGRFDPWSHLEKRDGVYGDLNGVDDDGNGIIDDIIGFDFVDQSVVNIGDYSNPDPIPEDEGGHGTLVAGVMSAKRNNHIGISGIAYNAKLMTVKAFDATGNAESDDIARAILYSVLNGAKVLNFSFGERNESPIVYDAIKFAYSMNCVMVASSGNNGWNLPHYPSDHPEVISVGGIDENLRVGGKTNYGSMLDVTAPATNIMTCDVGGVYKYTSGTSLSAPMVSALAALLLEKYPELSPSEIRSTIQMSANRINDDKWSTNYGAGIIDVNKTLETTGISNFEIVSPKHEQTINKDIDSILEIKGTVNSTLFDSYDFAIGKDIMPNSWLVETEKFKHQVANDLLAKININSLEDGLYTLSLRIYQKNLNVIERRIYLNIISNNSRVQLQNFQQLDAYYNDKRAVIIGAVTDRKCKMFLKYSESDSKDIKTTQQFDFNSQYHTIILSDEITPEITYNAEAYFFTNQNDTLIHKFQFSRKNDIFQITNFERKPYSMPRSYLLNQVADLYGNGKKHLAVNDLSSLFIGESRIYEFDNNKLSLKDSSAEGWIPAGIGDSNGDGILEIFGTADGMSTVKQAKILGDSPYSQELYRSALDTTFWAEKIFDIDGDGVDELIAYKYDSKYANHYVIYKFINGKYELLTRAILPDEYKDFSLTRGSAIADFDGDGKYELVFANTRGNLFIYEFDNNELKLEYIDEEAKSSSIQFIEKPDIDGDGTPEIMHAYAGSKKLFAQNEVGIPLWTVRILKATGKDTYSSEIWSENIYGVRLGATRNGIFYRNGSAIGDLNGDGKDEIILSLFPNLYIWTYDENTKKMIPFWYYPTTFSNSAVVYDFDDNGKNEIAFTTFSNTSFFEFIDKNLSPKTPKNFDGWATSQTSAYFKWDKVGDGVRYAFFLVDRSQIPPKLNQLTTIPYTEVVIKNLNPDTYYEFVLSAYYHGVGEQQYSSDFTEIVGIYTAKNTKISSVENVSKQNLILNFEGRLKGNYINPENFEIYDLDNNFISSVKSATIISENKILISYDKELSANNFLLKNYPFRDFYNNYINRDSIIFELIEKEPEKELYLISLEVLSQTLLRLQYSEEVEKESAENPNNYTMLPFGKVFNAEIDNTNNSKVLLNLTQEIRKDGSRGKNYTITVSDVKAKSGNEITKGSGNTLGFVISSDNLRNIYVYPNPIRKSEELEIYFANLTHKAKVTIMTSDGAEIITLIESDGNGGVEWNGRDINGNYLETGIYLFKVSGTNSEGREVFEEINKFVIIP